MPQILHINATHYGSYSHCMHACFTASQQGLQVIWRTTSLSCFLGVRTRRFLCNQFCTRPRCCATFLGVRALLGVCSAHHGKGPRLVEERIHDMVQFNDALGGPCGNQLCGCVLAWQACCYPDKAAWLLGPAERLPIIDQSPEPALTMRAMTAGLHLVLQAMLVAVSWGNLPCFGSYMTGR